MASLLALITGDSPQRLKIADVIVVDATTREVPTYEADLSKNPVEDGPDVTDHIRIRPVRLEIEGVISETPLTLASSVQGLVASGLGGIAGRATGSSLVGAAATVVGGAIGAKLFGESKNPALEAYKKLLDLFSKREPFTVTSKLESYANMVITKLTFPRDPRTGKALIFNATFEQIQVVVAKTARVKALRSDVKHTGGGKDSLGNQSSNPADANTQSNATILRSGWQLAGGR